MNTNDIIALANDIKNTWNTNDPFEIADYLGIKVMYRNECFTDFTAQTLKIEGYPTIISINDDYTDFSKKLLCAHELGHALLHEDCLNHFATTHNNVSTTVEQEANIFALALLTGEDFCADLPIPLASMNNYLLKSIIDYNLKKK